MKTFNDSKSQHLEELEALISSSLSEKELEDRLSDYHDNDIAEILEKLAPQERLRLYRILGVDRLLRFLHILMMQVRTWKSFH